MKFFDVYSRWGVEPIRAKGCKIYDKEGVEYLDFYGGHAVISIGHSHPSYVKNLKKQIERIGFYSNSVEISIQNEYAQKLGNISEYSDYSLFLVNSGAEANENALKLASFHNGKKKIVSFYKSFHGRTNVASQATDISEYKAPISSQTEVVFLSIGDIDTLQKVLEKKDVSSVIIEGIQGIGGVVVPDKSFLQYLREICNQTETVLILDEIQSGFGRTGKFFAHQHAFIRPDLITIAKGMGNGFPISGVLISPSFFLRKGQLGTTFGGNYLACTAAMTVLDVMEKDNLISNAKKIGEYLITELKKFSKIKEVRGLGLMIGIEMEEPISLLRNKLLFEHKIFTGLTGLYTFRLLPPLCLSKELADKFLYSFRKVLF